MNLLALSICICLFVGYGTPSFSAEILTSTHEVALLVAELLPATVQVESLVPAEQDVHEYQLKPSQLQQIQKAKLIFILGRDAEKPWWPRQHLDSTQVVDLSKFLNQPLANQPRSAKGSHAMGNPHYVFSPQNAILLLPKIKDELCKLYAQDLLLQQKISMLTSELEQKINAFLAQAKMELKGFRQKIWIYHEGLDIFYKDVGLVTEGFIEQNPGVAPSPQRWLELKMKVNRADSFLLLEPDQPKNLVKKEFPLAHVIILNFKAQHTLELYQNFLKVLK